MEDMNSIYISNIHGFMRDTELQFLYNEALKCNSVLEIGSYKGKTTHALCTACKGQVTAVDIWQKDVAAASYNPTDPLTGNIIYDEFIKNVGHFPNLRILKMWSTEAKQLLKQQKFDMIFIDADHAYEAISSDLDCWTENATKIICGHDYEHRDYPGVKKAVDERFKIDGVIDFIWYKYIKGEENGY